MPGSRSSKVGDIDSDECCVVDVSLLQLYLELQYGRRSLVHRVVVVELVVVCRVQF